MIVVHEYSRGVTLRMDDASDFQADAPVLLNDAPALVERVYAAEGSVRVPGAWDVDIVWTARVVELAA